MKTMQIGTLKTNISSLIERIENGEEITLTKGSNNRPLAIVKPYIEKSPKKRKLDILKGKASFKLMKDFIITDEELLGE